MYSRISDDLWPVQLMNVIAINVAQQLKESVGSVRQYDINESTEAGLEVNGNVRLLRTDRSILVTGKLEAVSRDTCSRCLEEFDHPVTLDVEEEYLLPRDADSDQPSPPQGEAGAFAIDENNILDLSEAVRQYTLLAVPMKPVCQQDCAGLCVQCGRNLNQGPCGCTPVRPDSHWAQLQGLLSKDQQSVQ
jgi:uncharacterized protein